MSAAAELQTAARAIRARQAPDATFHRRTGELLDHLAVGISRGEVTDIVADAAVRVARAYLNPATPEQEAAGAELRDHLQAAHGDDTAGLSYEEVRALHLRLHLGGRHAPAGHDLPARLHTWVGVR